MMCCSAQEPDHRSSGGRRRKWFGSMKLGARPGASAPGDVRCYTTASVWRARILTSSWRAGRGGKVVVATRPAERAALAQLEARGRANGLTGVRQLGREELRELEPEVAGHAALWVPETGVVDFAQVATALARRVRAAGAEIRTSTRVLGAREDGSGLVVVTSSGELRASLLVVCAGLYADRVARACGVNPGMMIIPFRGEYYD